jgi:hypothetical protein
MDAISTKIWMIVTQFGAASAILPTVPVVMLGLWREGRRNVIITWSWILFVGIAIVLISKVAFLGWGLGIAGLDFTGVSGHTMLATAILPVVFLAAPAPPLVSCCHCHRTSAGRASRLVAGDARRA